MVLNTQFLVSVSDFSFWPITIQNCSMIEAINHTGITLSSRNYTPTPSIPAERSGIDGKNVSQTSSKYILENKRIVFERYDRNGKLISTVRDF